MRILVLFLLVLPAIAYFNPSTPPSQAPIRVACSDAPPADLLYHSPDGGKTWYDLNQGLPASLDVSNVWAQDGIIYLGASNGDLFFSGNPDMGLWEKERVESPFSNLGGLEEGKMITGIYPGRTGPYVSVQGNGFYRKNSAAGLWEPMHQHLEEDWLHAVVEHQQGAIIIAGSTGIYKSADDGKSWKHVFKGYWISGFASLDNVLVCSGHNGLLRSDDGGDTWHNVLKDPDGLYKLWASQDRFFAARVAGSKHEPGFPARLLTSVDGGNSWQPLGDEPAPFEYVYELVQAGNYLYCSHNAGISCSSDDGKTWSLVRAAPDDDGMKRFSLAVMGQTVFAVLVQGGC